MWLIHIVIWEDLVGSSHYILKKMRKTIDIISTTSDICNTIISEMPQENFPNGVIEEVNGNIQYTKEAQIVFNQLYKKYYSIIEGNEV